jgi:hypothetical protein
MTNQEIAEDLRSIAIMWRVVPESWTQYAEARDERGIRVEASDKSACSWCASGAVREALPTLHDREKALKALAVKSGCGSVLFWNDLHIQSPTQAAEWLEAAAELLERTK